MIWNLTLKLFVGLIGILFFLRLTGKTQMVNMTPIDTVNGIVLGAIIGSVMYSSQTSVWMLVYGILVWTLFNVGLRYLLRWDVFNRLINGHDELLISDGMVNLKVLKRNNLDIDQLRTKLHEQEIYSLKDVKKVRFETDGQLTVFKNGDTQQSYLLIRGGDVIENEMKEVGLTKRWLQDEMAKLGYDDCLDIFAAEWTPRRGFYVIGRDGKVIDKSSKEDPRDKAANRNTHRRHRNRNRKPKQNP